MLPDAIVTELNNSKHAVMNVRAAKMLRDAISTGESYGDDIQAADVNIQIIVDATYTASLVPDPIEILQQLLAVGNTICSVRRAFVDCDFVRLTKVLSSSCSDPVLSPLLEQYAANEMHAFLTDLESRRVCISLISCCCH